MTDSVDRRYCIGDDCYPTEQRCFQRSNILGYLSFSYLGLIIITGCVLSYQSRKLPNCLSEAKFIMLAMYNVAIFSIMVGIVLSVGRDELPASVETLLITLVIFFISTGSVLLVFGPKFLKIWKLPESEIKIILQSSMASIPTQTITYTVPNELNNSNIGDDVSREFILPSHASLPVLPSHASTIQN